MRHIIEATIKYRVVSPELDSDMVEALQVFVTEENIKKALTEKVSRGLGWQGSNTEGDLLEVTEVKSTYLEKLPEGGLK